jgi:hypothetical protein
MTSKNMETQSLNSEPATAYGYSSTQPGGVWTFTERLLLLFPWVETVLEMDSHRVQITRNGPCSRSQSVGWISNMRAIKTGPRELGVSMVLKFVLLSLVATAAALFVNILWGRAFEPGDENAVVDANETRLYDSMAFGIFVLLGSLLCFVTCRPQVIRFEGFEGPTHESFIVQMDRHKAQQVVAIAMELRDSVDIPMESGGIDGYGTF